MTFIGYHTEISPEEAYQKCPEFWDKEYAAKYVRLWQTMQPENAVEKAILDNGIGMYAICTEGENGFTYWIPVCTGAERYRRDWSYILFRRVTGQFSQQEAPCRIPCRL